MHNEARLANLLGAAALHVSETMLAQVRAASGTSTSGAAALVVLAHLRQLSVTELGRGIGLSQPAAARMVDSLVASGLVRRLAGSGRTVPVELTDAGREVVREVLDVRAAELSALIADLDEPERRTLSALLEKLLTGMYDEAGSSTFLCRLCDRHSCTESDTCPVGQAERTRRA
ncbi:MarR family transcriptional regulator [Georgenia halophila]|uniref:MarR family transcriptional regulator n=1 Tax=Georgenia halophila TaxID=620889 RepID=A0ABP8KYH7_9MICO